jgi:hypothetical protein
MKGQLRGLSIFGIIFLRNQLQKLTPFLNLGGTTGIRSIRRLHQEKLQEDTIRLQSLQYVEYQMSFILMDPHMTTNILIQIIYGTDIVMNH